MLVQVCHLTILSPEGSRFLRLFSVADAIRWDEFYMLFRAQRPMKTV